MLILKNKRLLLILSVAVFATAAFCMIGMNAKYTSQRDLHSSVQVSLLLQGDEADLYESPVDLQTDGSYKISIIDTKEAVEPKEGDVQPSRLNKYDYILPGVNLPKDPKIFVTKKSGAHAYLYLEVFEEDFPGNYTNNGFAVIDEADPKNTRETDAIYYQLEDHWRILKDSNDKPILGPNGGNLYVYYNTTDSALATYTDKNNGATYIASYIMKDDTNGSIPLASYYGVNEVKKTGDVENAVPYFNIIKDDTIYVSEKYIHKEYYSNIAPEAEIAVDNDKYNFGLYFYGYMASAKENGSYVTPEKAFNDAKFLNEQAYKDSLNKQGN